ncbi:hypothetical protein V5799_030878 [Amblyomma americanum]|uniref:tRNA pseudouridine(55) synthase n=1 Tax=Amblyomma americanum TaxID=6943 RepID=A0AAQ4ELY0_AMBAM
MPLTLPDADKPTVFDHLREIGCCKLCAERFTGERYYDHYKKFTDLAALSESNSNETVCQEKEQSEEPASKRPRLADAETSNDELAAVTNAHKESSPEQLSSVTSNGEQNCIEDTGCIACYSLLDIQHIESSFQQIAAAVKESGCIFSMFTILLSVPVTLDLRHHAMVIYLKDKFEEFYKGSNDIDFVSAKEVWKYIVGPMFADHFGVEFSATSGFRISVALPSPNAQEECGFLLKKFPESFPNRLQKKHQSREIFTRAAVLDALRKISNDEFRKLYKCPPDRPAKVGSTVEVSCVHMPIYLAGRYSKYSRLLSQTPWILNGKRIMESSVQELITDVVNKHIPNEKIMFSSSGREDVDVRMLGRGRPFVLEIFKTKKTTFTVADMEAIEQEINANTKDISVSDLQVISKDMTQVLKDGEESKRKRRNLAERERTVYEMSLEPLEGVKDGEHRFYLRITTQAGTYIKEFVHGDFGRTVPSLGTYLNMDADILELDVEEIDLDWPPPRK